MYQRLYSVRNIFSLSVAFEVLFAKKLPLFLLSVTIFMHVFNERFSTGRKAKIASFYMNMSHRER